MSFDLSNQYVSQSYQNLVQISGSILTTGLGTSINQLNITGVTASLIGTSSWAINAVTASFAPGYVLTSQTASIVLGYVLTSSTGSMLQPYVLTSTTSSMKVLSSSYAVTASYANFAANSNIATTGSTLYSTNPITSNVATVNSIFLGNDAGRDATNANNSNFLGATAGYEATNAAGSNFIGGESGYQATNASQSNFLGNSAGYQATNANNSNFLGNNAGNAATNANNSNFFGTDVGTDAPNASYSNLFGYNVGSNNIGSNNIIIGTNVTLANGRKDSINLGGIIFATGSHNSLATRLSGSVTNAKVGICNSLPLYTLDVSGSGKFTDGVNVTGSLLSIGEVNLKNPYNSNIQLLITGSYNPLGLGPSNVIATQAQSASISTGFGTFISTGSNADLGITTFCRNSASGDLVVINADYASNDNTLGVGLAYFVNNVTDVLSIGVTADTVYTLNSKTASGSGNFTALNGDNDSILELYNNGDYVQTNVTSSIAFVNLGNAVVAKFTSSYAGTQYIKQSGGDDWYIANATVVGISGSNTVISNQDILIDNNSNQRTEIINTVGNESGDVQYIKISHTNTSTDDYHAVSVSPLGVAIDTETTNEGTMILTATSGSVYIGEDPQIGLTTMTITNSGHVILPFVSSSFNYANDAAAASGNVPLGGIYHTSGSLKIRLT